MGRGWAWCGLLARWSAASRARGEAARTQCAQRQHTVCTQTAPCVLCIAAHGLLCAHSAWRNLSLHLPAEGERGELVVAIMGWRKIRVTFVKWRDDDLLPEGRGLFHSRRIHQAALQVEGTACSHQYLALFCGIWWRFGWFWLWWRIVWRLQRVACQVEGMSCSVLEEHFSIAFGEQFRIQIILSSSCQENC